MSEIQGFSFTKIVSFPVHPVCTVDLGIQQRSNDGTLLARTCCLNDSIVSNG